VARWLPYLAPCSRLQHLVLEEDHVHPHRFYAPRNFLEVSLVPKSPRLEHLHLDLHTEEGWDPAPLAALSALTLLGLGAPTAASVCSQQRLWAALCGCQQLHSITGLLLHKVLPRGLQLPKVRTASVTVDYPQEEQAAGGDLTGWWQGGVAATAAGDGAQEAAAVAAAGWRDRAAGGRTGPAAVLAALLQLLPAVEELEVEVHLWRPCTQEQQVRGGRGRAEPPAESGTHSSAVGQEYALLCPRLEGTGKLIHQCD
jgi:hypothetical protein